MTQLQKELDWVYSMLNRPAKDIKFTDEQAEAARFAIADAIMSMDTED